MSVARVSVLIVVLCSLVLGVVLLSKRPDSTIAETSSSGATVQDDPVEAAALFQQAQQYESGEGVQQSRYEAGRLYALAALKGSKAAQDRLSEAKTKCVGNVGPDGSSTYEPYSCFIAAATNDPHALHAVGVAYLSGGGGLQKDKRKAFDWFMKAALAGSTTAAIHLGMMYDRGDGIPQDYMEALAWFTVAEGRPDLNELARKSIEAGKRSAASKLSFKEIHDANVKAITYKKQISEPKH